MKSWWLGLLAGICALAGCVSSHGTDYCPRAREWEPERAREILCRSLEYAGCRNICVGPGGFSYELANTATLLDTSCDVDIEFCDINCVEVEVTQVDYQVLVHLASRDGGVCAEIPFASWRSAQNCADALQTLAVR